MSAFLEHGRTIPLADAVARTFPLRHSHSIWWQVFAAQLGWVRILRWRRIRRTAGMNDKDLPGRRAMRHLVQSRSKPQDRVIELLEQQAAISEVLRALANSPHGLQPIFVALLDSSIRLLRADVVTLRLSEEGGLRLVAMRGDPLLVSHLWSSFPALAEKGSLQSRIATSRRPAHIPDLAALEIDHRDSTWITA